jgi:hypothetical protein
VALGLTLFGGQQAGWWPAEFWQQAAWPIAVGGVALGAVLGLPESRDRIRWLLAAVACCGTAYVTMPAGESWQDIVRLHRHWMLAMTLASFANIWMLEGIARHAGQRWVLLVVLAGLGGPLMLAVAAYASLAEWIGAGVVAITVAALGALVSGRPGLWGASYPGVLLSVSGVAAARFYTYSDFPPWLYGILLLLPTVVGLIDIPLRKRSTAVRVTVAFFVSLILLGLAAWQIEPWTLFAGGEVW